MRNLLPLLILLYCHIIQGVFEWTVIGKVTDYGQNVTLLCNVPNCCPKESGWDRWTPHQRTLFIDVKSGHSNKKYDGKVVKDGYTLIIQNLTKEDLNVSYSCLYGVTLGESKFLLEEDVFTYVTTTQPNGNTTFSESEIAALVTGVSVLVSVAILVYCWIIRKRRMDKGTKNEEMKPFIQQVAVTKERYSQVYGSKVEIKVDIPSKSKVKSVIWNRNGKTLDTSSSSKYAPVNVTNPSLIIYSISKADVGVYVCKVVFEAENENEEEQETSSPNIEVELKEVAVTKERYSQVYGSKVEIKVDIPSKSKVKSVIWNRNGKTLDTSSSSKYAPVNVTNPSLIIYSISKADVGVYVCKVVFEAENENEEEQETSSPNIEVELKEVAVITERYSQAYGSKVEIKVDIPGKSKVKSVIWYRNEKTLDTSSSSKYAPVNVTQPSLIIYSISKADAGVYVCKVVFEAENENEEEQKTSSPNIEVELKVPLFVYKEVEFKADFGDEVSMQCKIFNCPEKYELYWEHISKKGEIRKLQTSESTQTKYSESTKNYPNLTITNLVKDDAAFYRCCIRNVTSEDEFEYRSENVKLLVLNEPLVVCRDFELKADYGREATIQCEIDKCPDQYEIFWEKIPYKGERKKLQTGDTEQNKYSGSTKDYPHLTIKDLVKDDAAYYRCCIKNVTSEKEFEFRSKKVKLFVLNEPLVVCQHIELKADYGREVTIQCGISNCPDKYEIFWEKILEKGERKKLQTGDTEQKKYSGSTKDYPHLTITNLVKDDAAFYRCSIKNVISDRELEFSSQKVKLLVLNEPLVLCQDVHIKKKIGDEVSIQCEISNCPEKYEIYWEKITEKGETKKLQTNDTAQNKYSGSTKDYPHLTIKEITKEDAAFYCCCLKHVTSEKDFEFRSKTVKLLVFNGKTNLLTEIENEKPEEYEAIPKAIRDQNRIMIDKWIEKDEKFVPTRASEYVMKCLLENSCLTLTGCAGVGKSFIARHAALSLQTKGYNIIPVYLPTDIRDYYQPGKQTVFIVDDICGNFTANQIQIETWTQLLPVVKSIMSDNCKIIVSCRLQVYKDDKFNSLSLFKKCQCNLISDELCLTNKEKISMANKYMGARLKDIDDSCLESEFFPLLCSLYDDQTNPDVKTFFSKPFHVYKSELDNLSRLNDEGKYKLCSLALCVLFNNHLREDWFQGNETDEQRLIIETTREACKLLNKPPKAILKDELENLEGTLICKQNGSYSTIHDKMFDFLAHYFGQTMIQCLIEHGDSDLINERFIWLQSSDLINSNKDFIIEIPDAYLETYLKRLTKNWEAGMVTFVFENNNMKVSVFRQHLLQYLNKQDKSQRVTLVNIRDKSPSKDHNTSGSSPLVRACCLGYTDMVRWIFLNYKADDQYGHDVAIGLHIACQKGYIDILNILMKKNPDVDLYDDNGCCPLILASQYGSTDIVKVLLERNPNVDLCNNDKWSPLYMASMLGHIPIVELLLQKNPNVDLCDIEGCSPLYIASQYGHTEIVKLLLEKNSNVDLCDENGCSPIYEATFYGHIDIIKLLIEKNPNLDLCDSNGLSPLFIASEQKQTNIVSLLLEKKPNVDLCDNAGCCPLYVASKLGYIDIVMLLLENNPNVDLCDHEGRSSLYKASTKGHTEIVKLLLAKNPNVDQCNDEGQSSLYKASKKGHTEIVKLLLTKNPNVDLCDNAGCCPLYVASKLGYIDIVMLLLENNPNVDLCDHEGRSSLYKASTKGHTEIVKLLLAKNPNVDKCDDEGQSSLHKASTKGHIDVVKLLLERKSNVDLCDNYGCSPLVYASQNGYIEIVRLLIKRHANVDKCDINGCSPLFIASQEGHIAIVRLILEKNPSVDLCRNDGCSSINVAIKQRQTDIVKLLLERNPNVDQCDKNGCSPLYMASENGLIDIVRMLLERNPNVDLCEKSGCSPLNIASKNGHTDIVKLLLERNPNVDQCDKNGYSPLYMASQNGLIDIVRMLLERSPNVDLCEKSGCSPLNIASKNGHTDIVKLLLERNPNVDKCDKNGCNPLFIASQEGHIAIVRLILEKNPSVDLCRNDGCSSINVAIKKRQTDIVKLLLERNPNVDQCDKNGCSPLYMASENGQIDIVRMLLERNPNVDLCEKSGCSPLNIASKNGHTDIVKLMLERNPNVDLCDKYGCSPLQMASTNGRFEIVRMLLKKIPKINLCALDGSSPLKQASQNGHSNIVKLLLEKNSDVDLCDVNGCSPLYKACQQGHTSIVKLLLEKNPKVDLCDKDGHSPLYLACQKGRTDIVRLLLENNPNVDLCDNDGRSPLYMACQTQNTDIVKVLLEKNPNVDLCDTDGRSPLYTATNKGYIDIVVCLLKKKADVNLCNKKGYSPLYLASQNGNTDLVRMLLESNSTVDLCVIDGFSPLIIACANNKISIVKLLLKYKPNINAQTFDGGTALYFCALTGNLEVLQLLLENNADLNICVHSKQYLIDTLDNLPGITLDELKAHLFQRLLNSKTSKGTEYVGEKSKDYVFDVVTGFSPLHIASFLGRTDVIRYLLDHKVNINMTKQDGTTPLFYACTVGHEDIVQLLLNSGADTNMRRDDGKSPLNIAIENGHILVETMVTKHLKEGHLSIQI